MMRARCIPLMQHALPSLSQIAQTMTPELVLQPRYQQHRNGARSIRDVILCHAAPAEIAATYAGIAGHAARQRGDDWVIDLGGGTLTAVTPARLGALIPGAVPPVLPYLAGFTVIVDDLARPRAALRESGVPFVEHDGRVTVAAKEACGCAVLFAAG
jgi:hypothetical protein